MTPRLIRKYCRLDTESETMLERAMSRLGLSARAYDRILKVRRTLLIWKARRTFQSSHVAEAVHYRSLDRTSDHGPNLLRYSSELMKALTISAWRKSPLNWFSLVNQKL
jgi:hypothetical protein